MEMTITNFAKQKSINIELPDEMTENIEELRFIIGLEQFKLVSTKTEEDKKREKAAVDFGEEVYDGIYAKYPDFGKEGCKTTKEDMVAIIKEELNKRKEKYSVLLNDKNPDLILSSLVTAYSNYCTVRARMEQEDKMIEETKLDDNVFFDYIKRFKKAFQDAKCIKDMHESIVKLHQYAGIDKRELFGYTFIFDCINPFFAKIKEIETELDGMKPKVALKDHAMYSDESYWNDIAMQSVVKESIGNLDALIVKYSKQEDINVPVFEYYARPIIDNYRRLIANQNNIAIYLKSVSDETGKINELNIDQTNKLTELVNELNSSYKQMLKEFADLRVRFNLDTHEWNPSDRTIINANFGLIDFWIQTINQTKEDEKNAQINKMIAQFDMHSKILEMIGNGKLKSEDIVNGKYSNTELIQLVEESSK